MSNTSSQFRWKTDLSNPYARLGTYCYLLAAINFQSPIVWHFMQVIHVHVDACNQYEFQFFIWHELIAQICWFWSPVVCLFICKLFIILYLSLELQGQFQPNFAWSIIGSRVFKCVKMKPLLSHLKKGWKYIDS